MKNNENFSYEKHFKENFWFSKWCYLTIISTLFFNITKPIGYVIKADSKNLTAFFFKIQKLIVADTKTTAIIRNVTVYSAVFPFFFK